MGSRFDFSLLDLAKVKELRKGSESGEVLKCDCFQEEVQEDFLDLFYGVYFYIVWNNLGELRYFVDDRFTV
jgi:hypothetical protein